jgi:hypothetical protein
VKGSAHNLSVAHIMLQISGRQNFNRGPTGHIGAVGTQSTVGPRFIGQGIVLAAQTELNRAWAARIYKGPEVVFFGSR